MQSKPNPTEQVYANGVWLMGPDGEYLQRHRCEADARCAVRDFNQSGRALAPTAYARRRS